MIKRVSWVSIALAFALWGATAEAPRPQKMPAPQPRAWRLQPEIGEDIGWKPQEPFDLAGPMPGAADVRGAICKGIEFVLSRQRHDGGWDDALTGTMLSVVADQALDAVSLTSLCGLALRAHAHLDKRIAPALERAVSFILARVFLGKLPLKVYYANWRYTYGLQFLVGEFRATANESLKAGIKACARRMVASLLKMQLSNGEANVHAKTSAAKVDIRQRLKRLPGQLGLSLAAPSEHDFRGGARVLASRPNGAAALAGVLPGDRVLEVDGTWIENALDYYALEQDFIQGQAVSLLLRRNSALVLAQCRIGEAWPQYLGIEVGGGKGPETEIVQFLGLSPAEKAGLKIGDVLSAINGTRLIAREDFYAALLRLGDGSPVAIDFIRDGVAQSLQVTPISAPEADLGIFLSDEDISGGEGILVGASMVRPQPGPVVPGPGGAALGMKPGDRVLSVNSIPVFAIDLFEGICAANPAGVPVSVEWLHGEKRMQGRLVPRARLQPGSLGVVLDVSSPTDPPVVKSVLPDSAAALGGIAPGDTIMSINDISVPTHVFFTRVMARFYAGEEVRVGVLRGVKLLPPGRFRLDKASAAFSDIEEGGWSYYPDLGESMSFSTAAALLALYDAASLGIAVPKEALKAGENLVDSLRAEDASHAGVFSYHYRRSLMTKDLGGYNSDVRGSLGRMALCDLCLLRAGRRAKDEVERSLRTWLEFRGELDRVRNYPYTHLAQLYNNAAYYWLFGHWYAMKAAREIGGKTCESVNAAVVKALMLKREKDGTWLHHESFGKTCGTAMALLALGETQGEWRK